MLKQARIDKPGAPHHIMGRPTSVKLGASLPFTLGRVIFRFFTLKTGMGDIQELQM